MMMTLRTIMRFVYLFIFLAICIHAVLQEQKFFVHAFVVVKTTPINAFTTSATTINSDHRRQQIQRNSNTITSKTTTLYAAKLLYKWKVLPSGSITGIYQDDMITTSTIIGADLSRVTSNSILTTSSGSQYKLMGEPTGKNPFATTTTTTSSSSLLLPSLPPLVDSKSDDSLLMTNVSVLVLTAVSAIFAFIIFQKFGATSSSVDISFNDLSKLSWRVVALLLYTIGIIIATFQLIQDANKLSK